MQKAEFIERMKNVPWADRACSFDACDCWGLVVLYYRHVLGTELYHLPGYETGADFLTCYRGEVEFWQSCRQPVENGIFVAYAGDRAHVGLILDGAALHSRGEGGGVMHTRLRVIESMFSRVEYLTYAGHRNTARTGAAQGEG